MIKPALAALAISLVIAGSARGAEPAAQDFAYGAWLQTQGESAAYRFALPVDVYQHVVNTDLRDLRIFNGRGETTPLHLTLPADAPESRPRALALPMFPLHGGAEATLETLRVTIGGRGATLRVLQQGSVARDAKPVRYVLDGRGVDAAVTALVVQWPDGAADFAGNLLVEAGDALGSWRTVVADAPIANLHANGQQLLEQRVVFPATRAKFWRLTWVGPAAPFELSGASVETAGATDAGAYSSLSAAGIAVAGHAGDFEFDLGARAPVERINLVLPALNTIVGAQLYSRAMPGDPWRNLTQSVFYRMSGASGELHNGPLAVAPDTDRYWLVRLAPPGNSLGSGTLRLEAQWRAHELSFLARGGGPYRLAFGSASIAGAGPVFDSLPPGTSILEAVPGPVHELGGLQRLQPPPRPFPWKTTLLWAVLALGVALLAGMTYRLSRSVGHPPA